MSLNKKTFQHESCRTFNYKKLLFWPIFKFQHVFLFKSQSNIIWPRVNSPKFILLHKPRVNMKVVGFWILRNFCFDQNLSFNIKILGNLSQTCLLHGQLSSSSLPHKWAASMIGPRLLARAGLEEVLRGPMRGKQA
jgi:hypothetical protein